MAGTGSGTDPFLWGRRAVIGLVVALYLYVMLVAIAIGGSGGTLEAKLFGVSAFVLGIALPVWACYRSPTLRSLW